MPDNTGYIVAAYVITWVVLVGYAVRLQAVSRRARARLEQATRELEVGDRE